MEHGRKQSQKEIHPKLTSGFLWAVGLWGIGILVHTPLYFPNYPLQ